MTLEDRCYYRARGTRTGATSAHISDGPSDISEPLLLPLTVAMGDITSYACCYYWARGTRMAATGAHNSDELYDIR
jgi:hypothetical protein